MHETLRYSLSNGLFRCRFQYLLDLFNVIVFEFHCRFVMFVGDLFKMCHFAELMMTHFNNNL